jgi:hypothetical protein
MLHTDYCFWIFREFNGELERNWGDYAVIVLIRMKGKT